MYYECSYFHFELVNKPLKFNIHAAGYDLCKLTRNKVLRVFHYNFIQCIRVQTSQVHVRWRFVFGKLMGQRDRPSQALLNKTRNGYTLRKAHHSATQNLVTCYIFVYAWESNLVKLLVHVILCGETDWKLHSLIALTIYSYYQFRMP